MVTREFQPTDADGCLAVFDSNTPTYFLPHERADYEDFLSTPAGRYFVVESGTGEIVACGGYALEAAATAVLIYGMVHAALHRQSLGTRLLRERLDRIREEPGVDSVIINTTQLTEGFFAKSGFQTDAVTPDRYAPGLHGVRMSLNLRFTR